MLSVDESMSSRVIYVIEKHSLDTKLMIRCWFGTDTYGVTVFEINRQVKEGKKELHRFKDFCLKAEGNYNQLRTLGKLLPQIKKLLTK